MADEPKNFLSRWSQRKQSHRSGSDDQLPEPESAEALEAKALAEAQEAVLAQEKAAQEALATSEINRLAAEAIDLDAISYGDDFSVFLKQGVSQTLRKKALRKFFNSDPLLANLDGLNDYDEDFNNPAHMVYKSSWNVTRGFLTESEQLLQQASGGLTPPESAEDAVETTGADELGAENEVNETSSDTPVEAEVLLDAEPVDDPEVSDASEPLALSQSAEETDEPEPLPTKRVSLRQRLNG